MGSSRCQQAVINSDGSLVFSRVVPTSEQHLRSAFTGLGGEASVHLEAGELSAWAAGIIRPLVKSVTVSHPRTLAWIARDPYPVLPIVRFPVQIGNCNNKNFRIQYFIDNSVRETTQLTSAGEAAEGMPGIWKTPDSLNRI